MWKVFSEYVLLYEMTTQVRIQFIHSVHSLFCIKCIEIIKQFREPTQETASGAMALQTGPASHSRVCSLGRKIVPPPPPQQFRSLQDPSGSCRENYGQSGAEYTTHSCLMLSWLRYSLLKHKLLHSIFKTKPRVLVKHTLSGITPVSWWAICSLIPLWPLFLSTENWTQKPHIVYKVLW